jgi:hypothetical protein
MPAFAYFADLPKNEPQMSGSEMVYAIGDQVSINCTSSKSYPAAELRWYINNQPVSFLIIYICYYFISEFEFACVGEDTGKRDD